jgi:segregation and condensation protein A
MSINVQLPKFEGPLGLLLYLIRKEEMDIMDIKIHDITKQYFEYIKLMRELDLEVAGEFVAMASTLIQIKSRILLPQYNDSGEVVESEDPRKELVQKLLEYQKYQEAAKLLYDRPLVGRDVWLRGTRETLEPNADEIVLEENALFSLISSYRKVSRAIKKKVHQVAAKAQSIASRVMELKDRLIVGHRITLMELLTDTQERARQALITFLSLLELAKMGYVGLYQTETYGDIWIDSKKTIESDVLSRVEEYDSMRADQIAEKLIEDSKKMDPQDELIVSGLASGGETLLNIQTEPSSQQLDLLDFSEIQQADEISMTTTDLPGDLIPDFAVGLDSLDEALDLSGMLTAQDLASDEDILAAENDLFTEHFNDAMEEV